MPISSLLRTENGLTTDIFVVKCTERGLVVKQPGVLSKVQMLGLGRERFKQFRFSVLAVPLQRRGFSMFQYSLAGKNGSSSGFGSWKTVPSLPVPLSVSGKTSSDGSGFRFRFGS